MERQQQQVPQVDPELAPSGANPAMGRLDFFREHNRQAMDRHRHTVSYRVPVELKQSHLLQQRFLQQQGSGKQQAPPTGGGRGGVVDKSQSMGGVDHEGDAGRLAEEVRLGSHASGRYL